MSKKKRRIKLYPHQKKAVKQIKKFKGRALLADEMGLGKTWEALWWCKKKKKKRPIIVVCPANLKWVWEAEASKVINMRGVILSGRKPPVGKRLTNSQELYIINYEILPYWLNWLKKLKAKILIIDEVHYQKNPDATRTKAIRKLASKPLTKEQRKKWRKKHGDKKPTKYFIPHILAISGTPLTNRPAELFTTLRLICPTEFPRKRDFNYRYCKPTMRPWGWEFKGASNIKELHRKLKRLMMIRNLKKDVLKDLPDKTRIVIPVPIKNPKEYEEAQNDFIKWLTKSSAHKAKKAERAIKLVQLGYLKRLAADLKMDAVLKWIEDFLSESDGKLVIFGIHKKIIKRIHEQFPDISVVIDGSTSHKKRKIAVKTFQRHKKIRLFIGNIKAAGVGITLTAAHTLVFVELDWVPGNHTQAEDRIHRIGQLNAAMIYYLVAQGTIEEKLCKILQKKQRILSQILDGSVKKNKLDVFKSLEKSLLRGK